MVGLYMRKLKISLLILVVIILPTHMDARQPDGDLGIYSRFLDYLLQEEAVAIEPCNLIVSGEEVCISVPFSSAAQFSEVVDRAIEVFHGLSLSRTGWTNRNGAWSVQISVPGEVAYLELVISEYFQFGAPMTVGILFLR